MQDRINIQRINGNSPFPQFNVSVQAIVSCNLGGTCYGGDSSLLFERARDWSVPVETCQNYEAHNPDKFFCERDKICSTNTPSGQKFITDFASIKVTKWGRVRGPQEMKAALKEGPIVCDFEVTPEFVKYGYLKDKSKVVIFD